MHRRRRRLATWWVGDPVRLDGGVLRRERDDDEAVAPDDAAPHPRVGSLRRHEVIDPDPEAARQRQEELQARLPLAGLEPGERARGHPGLLRELGERPAPCLPGRPQPGPHPCPLGLPPNHPPTLHSPHYAAYTT